LAEDGLTQDQRLRFDAAQARRRAACGIEAVGQEVPFDGIFAASDLAAIGAMRALHEARVDVPGMFDCGI
jgi:DNA-binding LacI/PurR family transcriptional regulator